MCDEAGDARRCEEEGPISGPGMDLFKKLVPYLKPHLRRLVSGLAGMGAFTVLSLLPPLLIRRLVNDVVTPGVWHLLLPIVVLIVVVPSCSHLIQFATTWIIRRTGYKLIKDIRMSLYEKIFRLSMDFHQDNSSGLLVNRLMDDVNALTQLVTGDTFTLFVNAIVFVFSVTIVIVLSPIIALILVAIIALYVISYRHYASRIRRSTTTFRRYYDQISERLEETVAGVRHVRIFNRELWENDRFLGRTGESLRHAMKSRLSSVSLSTVCTMIAGFGSAIVASTGAYLVLRGDLRYGDVFAINSYLWMALNPAIRFTSIAGQLTETFVSVRRIFEVLDTEPMIQSEKDAPELPRGRGRVEYRNVYFSYSSDVPLYRGLSLEVEPGMSVALVGHTGCGKTTFTSLLMRYWDIQSGEILIDGHDIRKVSLESLRRSFGVVLQDPIVFDGTLAENIAYGFPRATRAQIEEAARVAEIHEMARSLPDGFDTVIGTTGIKLSVGEKQRLSIARAIIKDPVILIMDEATSSLDSESEALIQKALSRILTDRTSFIVAHRLSTITSVDMIVVMDAGRIVEKGTHGELMAIPEGSYRKLYEELRGAVSEEV